jgi:outer membrane protein assembly factor BamB
VVETEIEMPSPPAPSASPPRSRRRFLRTAAATVGTGLTTAVAGCSTRNLFSEVDVQFRTLAVGSPPVGLTTAGVWLVAAGRDGQVVGLDRGDGQARWEANPVEDLRVPPVGHEGELYVAGEAVVSVNGAIERWRTPLPGLASALTVSAESVVAVGTEHGHVIAVAFDARTGEERWRAGHVASAVASADSSVLLGRRRVHSVRDGDVAWSHDTENNWTTGIVPVRTASVSESSAGARWLLAGTRTGEGGDVLALTADGERLWRHRLRGGAVALTPATDGRFVVGIEGEHPGVQQFTAAGETRWFFETETSVVDVVFGGDWVWTVTGSARVVGLSE